MSGRTVYLSEEAQEVLSRALDIASADYGDMPEREQQIERIREKLRL